MSTYFVHFSELFIEHPTPIIYNDFKGGVQKNEQL